MISSSDFIKKKKNAEMSTTVENKTAIKPTLGRFFLT